MHAPELTGHCSCGALTWQAHGSILWSAYCHCVDCRRAASSDYVSWLGVARSTLNWIGPRQYYRSSDNVMRSFCKNCGSPASFETDVFPEETHLYAATLDEPQLYQPTAHLFWSERLPWIQITDNLPKYPKGLQHAAQTGTILLD